MKETIEPISILLRVSAEIFDRSNRVKKYLNDIGPKGGSAYSQLSDTIKNALETIEQTLLPALSEIADDSASQEGEIGSELFYNLYDTLSKCVEWFVTVHELLVYFPRMEATPETGLALKGSFGNEYKSQNPSIILGSLFNAVEFDFLSLIKQRLPDIEDIVIRDTKNIVLQLAICDRSSPLAAAILGHELGHAIDLHNKISSNVAKKAVRETEDGSWFIVIENWCGEFTADLIAAEVLGPAPMLALLSMEYCIFPSSKIYQPSKSHPSTRWRLHVVSDFLKDKYGGVDVLADERKLYDVAWEMNLKRSVASLEDRSEEIESQNDFFEKVIRSIAKEIIVEIGKLKLPQHVLNEESLERCVARLKRGFPIGAQGIRKDQLQQELDLYMQKREKEKEVRAREFHRLLPKFKEKPLTIPSILVAGYKRRLEIINQLTLQKNNFSFSEKLKDICGDLSTVDAIIGSSITTSTIQKELEIVLGEKPHEKAERG